MVSDTVTVDPTDPVLLALVAVVTAWLAARIPEGSPARHAIPFLAGLVAAAGRAAFDLGMAYTEMGPGLSLDTFWRATATWGLVILRYVLTRETSKWAAGAPGIPSADLRMVPVQADDEAVGDGKPLPRRPPTGR